MANREISENFHLAKISRYTVTRKRYSVGLADSAARGIVAR